MTVKAPRITTRINQDTQSMLAKAAALSGISSINSFVLNAAIEKAKQILKHENTLILNQQDTQLLLAALDAPVKVNQNLQKAAQAYTQHNQNNI